MKRIKKTTLKIVVWVLGLIIMFSPEFIMWNLYTFIKPDTAVAKILILGVFWGLGAGLCFFMFFLGVFFISYFLDKTKVKK